MSSTLNLAPLPAVQDADPASCVLDSFRVAIAKRLSEHFTQLSVEQVFPAVHLGVKGIDFTVALPRFRLPGKVDELGKQFAEKFTPDEYVTSVSQEKAFVHFMVNTDTLIHQVLHQVHDLTQQGKYGYNDSGKGKKVIIEYSSPNIAKSFHVGHLRSTIIGAFLANLYKTAGWEVISMNYLGDWGTQFGLIASGFEKYGSQEKLEENAIKHLFDIYVQVSKDAENDPQVKVKAAEWFKRMEEGDEEALKNWRVWRQMSIDKYAKEYETLNVRFDVYTGESEVKKKEMDDALVRLQEKGLIDEVDGALLVNLEKYKMGKAVVRKKDGTSIYLTRDIGGAIQRYDKYKFDKMIYVISSQQDLHVSQFFKVLELLEIPWAKDLLHINYGLVMGMSTRKGTVVFLNQIIEEATTVMHEQMKKNEEKYAAVEDPENTSREIGISGIKIQDMAAKRINNYSFSESRMTSFEGDTGPYLQYAHVRLSSIARKSPHLIPLPPPSQIPLASLSESPHAREIVFLLATYPDVIKKALQTHEPSNIVTFAFKLSHVISSAYETLPVKAEQDLDKARARLWLFENAREVLSASLKLLSIQPLERM